MHAPMVTTFFNRAWAIIGPTHRGIEATPDQKLVLTRDNKIARARIDRNRVTSAAHQSTAN
jgi:hypothetical protein